MKNQIVDELMNMYPPSNPNGPAPFFPGRIFVEAELDLISERLSKKLINKFKQSPEDWSTLTPREEFKIRLGHALSGYKKVKDEGFTTFFEYGQHIYTGNLEDIKPAIIENGYVVI